MGNVGNQPLQKDYYNEENFSFTEAYHDFLTKIVRRLRFKEFLPELKKVQPRG
jgi:hypothetical protein